FELARATDAANDALLNRHLAARADWQARRRLEPEHWRDLGFTSQSIFWLTADEAAALKRDLEELVERYFKLTVDRYDNPEARPEGSRPVRFVAWSAPGPEPTASRTDTQEGGDAGTAVGSGTPHQGVPPRCARQRRHLLRGGRRASGGSSRTQRGGQDHSAEPGGGPRPPLLGKDHFGRTGRDRPSRHGAHALFPTASRSCTTGRCHPTTGHHNDGAHSRR